ncbi:MAG: hypothetical protein JWQ96_2203 [Segetibacter sp.]|nr:hypothetical protein [Segetibacter sp.]
MKQLHKKILPLFFLAILSLPAVYATYFFVKRAIVQHEMQEALEKASLTTITIPASQLVWYKKGKELLINSHLFDVKRISKKGEAFTVQGLYDVQEQALHSTMVQAFKNDPLNRAASSYAQFFINSYAVLINSSRLFSSPFYILHFDQYLIDEVNYFMQVISPPPQV